MIRLTDEMLMAYVDGALAEAEAAEVTATLAHDAKARAIVEEFRRTADLSRAAFADVISEPVPDHLVRSVLGSAAPTGNVVDLSSTRRPQPARWRTALPLAASVLLVVGLAAVLMLRSAPGAPIMALGPVPSATALAEMLETKASGVPVVLSGRAVDGADRLMVLATFRDRRARICREVEALDANMQAHIAGVACRDPAAGGWIVEGTARIAAPSPAGGGDYIPSGADQKDALDGLLTVLGAGKAMSTDEEQQLLGQRWR